RRSPSTAAAQSRSAGGTASTPIRADYRSLLPLRNSARRRCAPRSSEGARRARERSRHRGTGSVVRRLLGADLQDAGPPQRGVELAQWNAEQPSGTRDQRVATGSLVLG